jgi:G:T/U-mismatch repair DNA glycosylase
MGDKTKWLASLGLHPRDNRFKTGIPYQSKRNRLFHFIRNWRERRDAREARERQHQLAMLESIGRTLESVVDSQTALVKQTSDALIEIAKSNAAQAAAFSDWLKSFQTTSAPTATTVTEEDEYMAEQAKLLEAMGISPQGADVPEEFKLALALREGFSAEVRRDNRP